MKTGLIFFALLFLVKTSAFAKVVMIDDKVFLRTGGKQVPIFLVNDYITRGKVSKVNLYGDGKIHLISFSIDKGEDRIYSVDDHGFIYAIEPFSRYNVHRITDNDHFQFRELPGKNFKITNKGYFIH